MSNERAKKLLGEIENIAVGAMGALGIGELDSVRHFLGTIVEKADEAIGELNVDDEPDGNFDEFDKLYR